MEWWTLWVPFVGTIIGIFANYLQNKKQNKENAYFQIEIQNKQQEFEEKISKQQINANIISKSRIEWSKDVRMHAAEYLAMLTQIRANLLRLIAVEININKSSIELEKIDLDIKKNKLIDSFKSTSDEIILKSEILLLYFSEKEEHKDIEILLITPVDLNFKIRQKKLNIATMKLTADEYYEIIIKLRKELRKYLKNEWEVAKRI